VNAASAVGASIAVGLLAAGCLGAPGPRLAFAADPSIKLSLAQSNVGPADALSFGGIMVCVTSPGTAQIDAVRIDQPQGDIRVEAFAVRPNPMPAGDGLGAQRTTLAAFSSAFVPSAPQHVSGLCPRDPNAPTASEGSALSELGVQVRLGSGDLAGGRALDLDYRIDGGQRTLTIPFGIWLCSGTCPPGVGAIPGPTP
jgi:hypothetical protein